MKLPSKKYKRICQKIEALDLNSILLLHKLLSPREKKAMNFNQIMLFLRASERTAKRKVEKLMSLKLLEKFENEGETFYCPSKILREDRFFLDFIRRHAFELIVKDLKKGGVGNVSGRKDIEIQKDN
jgi:hypothetical protein